MHQNMRTRLTRLPRYLLAASLAIALSSCWLDDSDDVSTSADVTGPQIPAAIKQAFGADPNKTDTDGDGLSDAFEITYGYPILRPDRADTDGNGISDAAEDTDGDGLTNLEEQAVGTNPLSADTDGDGLTDSQEVKTYRTDPLKADTDGDGMADGREITNGTDPLVMDASKSIASITEPVVVDSETGLVEHVRVIVQGTGDLASSIIVRPGSDFPLPGQIGRRYDISMAVGQSTPIQSATITLPIDLTHASAADPSKLAIFTIDPTTGYWSELASTVDTTKKTITATTTHFSPFVAANKDTLNAATAALPKTCDASVKVDAALVIDSSGSMQTNDPSGLRKTAAQGFVASMKADDRALVVDFDSSALLRQGLTNNVAALNAAITQIDSAGGTNIGAGVSVGLTALGAAQPDRSRVVILLTDGEGSYDTGLTQQMAADGIRVFTIGLTGSVDEVLLRGIADSTGGIYQRANSADLLPNIFAQYATVFKDDGTDTDGDGITDCQEIQGVYVAALGRVIRTDYRKLDTDGDGIPDGVEFGIPEKINALPNSPYRSPGHSDPTKADTDGDGLSDQDEYRLGLNPLAKDTDGDGLNDGDEVNLYETDPAVADTDGDGLSDREEVLRAAEGFDPSVYDYKAWDFRLEFVKGLVFGDAIDIDTIPEIAGQMASSLVPIADARDLLANLVKGQWINAGLSLFGVIPYVGDTTKAVGSVTKFLGKFPTKRFELIKYVDKYLPDGIAKYLPAPPAKTGAWLLNPLVRGKQLEVVIANGIPGKALLGNYPSIDVFDFATGKAVSIKTLDLDAKTYQNASAFKRRLERYADIMVNFKSAPGWTAADGSSIRQITPGMITSREVVVGIPREMSAEFTTILNEVAATKGISFTTKVVQ